MVFKQVKLEKTVWGVIIVVFSKEVKSAVINLREKYSTEQNGTVFMVSPCNIALKGQHWYACGRD